ncbi:MAG: outer membrane beta-barrel protein [Pseudomonadota bacterium]
MRIVLLATALAATTALATPAFAQDSDPSFTGPRVEGIAGWDRVDDGANSGTKATDGVVYGGAVGYDFQVGGAVLGIEGEVTGATTKDETTGLVTAGDNYRVSAGRDLYAGVRAGFLVGPRTLLYAKGGYTNARINTRYTLGATTTEAHDDAEGWRAGAGAEFLVSNNVYVKGEYRYSNYSNIDGTNVDIDLDRHQVVAGVGFRF